MSNLRYLQISRDTKPILSPFSTIPSIMESFVMSFQSSIKFLMLPATNSDVLLLLLTDFSFW